MMRAWQAAVMVVLILPATLPSAAAQDVVPELYDYELRFETLRVELRTAEWGDIPFTFIDRSRTEPQAIAEESPRAGVSPHNVRLTVEPETDDAGWQASISPSSFTSFGGESKTGVLRILADNAAREALVSFNITLEFDPLYGPRQIHHYSVVGYTPGLAAFNLLPPGMAMVRPQEIVDVPVRIMNAGLVPRAFDMEVVDNPCGLSVGLQQNNLVGAKARAEVMVSVQAPFDKIWYFYEICRVTIMVFPSDNPDQWQTVSLNMQVTGGYVNPVWVFWSVGVVLLTLVLLLLARQRKTRFEEEILGKPQKPWTIPVEKVYLEHLREQDERAWYMVRHHLMEEEYQSALLWYHHYKHATRSNRTKQRVILREERRYDAWRKGWERRLARPLRRAKRHETALQGKLDRRARRGHRKDLRKRKRLVAKLEAAHRKREERVVGKWEKQKARAERKGRPVPERPGVPAPDLPPEPELVPIRLADHRWSKKAARHRLRMEKRHGDLEVRYEKADHRKRRRVVRRMRRIARKLDDPDFVEDHPMLADGA